MADVKPLKLVDQGGGAGRLEEFQPDDTLPISLITDLQAALDGKVDTAPGMGLSEESFTTAEKNKLAGVSAGATANATDAQLRDRATHTGTQAISTVAGLQPELEAKVRQSSATGAAIIPVGTGAQRPAWPSNGMLRYNATIEQFEGYQNGKWNSIGAVGQGGFRLLKTTSTIPAWAKSGAGLITAQALTYTLDGAAHELPGGTAISLPTLTAGNDYAIYATTDGRLVADLNWSAPSGEPAGTTRKIGGFHVALTGEVLEYSLWDINYRPTCPDPRGMVCINGMFWADIYLLGVNHHIDGTSRAGVTIADGASPPKIPAIYGGNGSTAYGSLTWFETQDVLQSHGKRCPSWAEFSMLAFGVTEATAVGADPVTTKHDSARRSRWGVEQATGNMWVWGADVQANTGGAWEAITGGRGSVFHSGVTAVLLGADWDNGAYSGSRSALWNLSPSFSRGYIGGRGLSDHLRLLAER